MNDHKKTHNPIPASWQWKALGEIALVGPNNGIFKRRQEFGEGAPLLNVADLYKSLKLDTTTLERVKVTDAELKKYAVQPGDLFFCRSSLKREGIGWCCYADEISEPTIFECHVMRIRPNPQFADSKYLAYYWQHPDVRNEIISKSKTATMTTMNQADLSEVLIPLPPLDEQKRIAAILDKADALREKRWQAIAKLDKLLQSVFIDMFGDPITNPKGWSVKSCPNLERWNVGSQNIAREMLQSYWGGSTH
jgi:type I restriction enzyme S subunit